jgi:hypothetical protein
VHLDKRPREYGADDVDVLGPLAFSYGLQSRQQGTPKRGGPGVPSC